MEMESVEDEVKAVNAEAAFDGEEDAATFLDEVIASSVEEAEMARVQRRLMPTLAQHVTKQLFEVVSACLPAYSGATHTPKIPSTAPHEEPAPGAIDVTCRHTIRTRKPPLVTSPVAPFARTGSFKTKNKRIVGLGTLAARSFLQGMRSPAIASPSRPSSRASSTRKLPIGDSTGGEVKDNGPKPGVPFSTANTPRPSPRKAIAVLKTSVDEEKDLVDEAIYPVIENIAEEDTGEEETVESLSEQAKKRMLRRFVRAKPKPKSPESSSSSYTLILPMKSPLFEKEDALVPVPIEFQLPPPSLPAITSPPRYTATRHNAMPTTASLSELSVPHSEMELVELDPLGSPGLELHETLDLAPGVKLQSPDGGITKVGPELPVVPSKMRRATFLDTSASLALESLKPSSRASQPVISPVRPTASAPPTSKSRFFLTKYDDDDSDELRLPSSPTCSSSNLSTTVSSNVASVKNLFRKPSKVVRPCTASAACTNGSRHSHVCQAATQAKPDDTFAELIKQRAFQRKPSILTASPPKKAIRQPQSRRPTEHTPAASPLARRSLQA